MLLLLLVPFIPKRRGPTPTRQRPSRYEHRCPGPEKWGVMSAFCTSTHY